MKIRNIWSYIAPIITLIVGGIAYFIIIPNICGGKMSSKERLYSDLQNAVDVLHNPNTLLFKFKNLDGVQLFWIIWLLFFVVTLFFFCKELNMTNKSYDSNMIFTKRDLYLTIQDARTVLVQVKGQKNSKELDTLVYKIKCLEEKLSVESEFGYGEQEVIECENKIVEQMQLISEIVPNIKSDNIDINFNELNLAIINMDLLLKRRTKLKTK